MAHEASEALNHKHLRSWELSSILAGPLEHQEKGDENGMQK